MKQIENVVKELKRDISRYTKALEVTPEYDPMRAYYQGKLDGLTMGAVLVQMAINTEKAKNCLVSNTYNPDCDCEMCGAR